MSKKSKVLLVVSVIAQLMSIGMFGVSMYSIGKTTGWNDAVIKTNLDNAKALTKDPFVKSE